MSWSRKILSGRQIILYLKETLRGGAVGRGTGLHAGRSRGTIPDETTGIFH